MSVPAPGQIIVWRRPRRRVFFALTPLIDVMFLLLIFFMLSSQVSPYALMPVGGVAAASGDAPATAADAASGPLAIRLSHGQARIGGRDIPLTELGAVAKGFVDQGITTFIVVPSASADAQDVVTTLEALKAVSAKDVTLVSANRQRP
jgi:biopolymer transport protein ExbD